MTKPLADKVLIAKINGIFGVNGWVKVYSYSDPIENILSYKKFFTNKDSKFTELSVLDKKKQAKTIIFKIKDINNPDAARLLMGADIYIDKSQLANLKEDEYYWYQLKGLKVINNKNIILGKVDYLLNTAANDVLVIKGDRERLIPYTDDVIVKVDLKTNKIIVSWDEDF